MLSNREPKLSLSYFPLSKLCLGVLFVDAIILFI